MTEQEKRAEVSVYDPRFDDRAFELPSGNVWHSRGTEIVVFEMDSSLQSFSGALLGDLLSVLVKHASPNEIIVGLDLAPGIAPPAWLNDVRVHEQPLYGRLAVSHIPDLTVYFDKHADYGVWTIFCGHFTTKRLPDVLSEIGDFDFYLEIDLDGMLIGFVKASGNLDEVMSRLLDVRSD